MFYREAESEGGRLLTPTTRGEDTKPLVGGQEGIPNRPMGVVQGKKAAAAVGELLSD